MIPTSSNVCTVCGRNCLCGQATITLMPYANYEPPSVCTGVGHVPSAISGTTAGASNSYDPCICDICGQLVPVDGQMRLTLHAYNPVRR
jgi:hypothetical protein